MNPTQSTANVAVTDLRMPFWSMVVFMVKWAVASIPAVVLLGAIYYGATKIIASLLVPGPIASMEFKETPATTPGYKPYVPQLQAPYKSSSTVPDRCKGSTEEAKCIEMERKLAAETSQQVAERQKRLEAGR